MSNQYLLTFEELLAFLQAHFVPSNSQQHLHNPRSGDKTINIW